MRFWQRLIATAVIFVLPSAVWAIDPVVRIDSGPVEGVPALTPGVTAFEGIPYAAPPVGDLRWKPPQPVEPWPVPAVWPLSLFAPAPGSRANSIVNRPAARAVSGNSAR
jgi:hypothetical protein